MEHDHAKSRLWNIKQSDQHRQTYSIQMVTFFSELLQQLQADTQPKNCNWTVKIEQFNCFQTLTAGIECLLTNENPADGDKMVQTLELVLKCRN